METVRDGFSSEDDGALREAKRYILELEDIIFQMEVDQTLLSDEQSDAIEDVLCRVSKRLEIRREKMLKVVDSL